MRFDTHRARAYVVTKLMHTPGIHDIYDDGTDIVVFCTRDNVKVMVHFFERLMSLVELRQLFEENSASGMHTLPLFWADMLLPGHGQLYEPDEWMMAMLNLQNSWIYGYEVFGEQVFLFGAEFKKHGWLYEINHGRSLDFSSLKTIHVEREMPPMAGNWYSTYFSETGTSEKANQRLHVDLLHLSQDFDRLHLPTTSSFAEVQQSYRKLARRLHPDNNDDSDANEQMKLLNTSYTRIRRHLMD